LLSFKSEEKLSLSNEKLFFEFYEGVYFSTKLSNLEYNYFSECFDFSIFYL